MPDNSQPATRYHVRPKEPLSCGNYYIYESWDGAFFFIFHSERRDAGGPVDVRRQVSIDNFPHLQPFVLSLCFGISALEKLNGAE
jgi:hypothetical protein